MTLLDLFSGIGGFTLGLEQAGFKFSNHYFSEVDKISTQTYEYRYRSAKNLGSVTDITEKVGADIITFGSPCQDFSGLKSTGAGISGSKSSLVLAALETVRRERPSVFIWENVKGAISKKHIGGFFSILQIIADIGGYECEWQLLDTSWFLSEPGGGYVRRPKVLSWPYRPDTTRQMPPISDPNQAESGT